MDPAVLHGHRGMPEPRAKLSAGTLLYRWIDGTLEVLLVHPAGNYNRRAPWGIPKGAPDPDRAAHRRGARRPRPRRLHALEEARARLRRTGSRGSVAAMRVVGGRQGRVHRAQPCAQDHPPGSGGVARSAATLSFGCRGCAGTRKNVRLTPESTRTGTDRPPFVGMSTPFALHRLSQKLTPPSGRLDKDRQRATVRPTSCPTWVGVGKLQAVDSA